MRHFLWQVNILLKWLSQFRFNKAKHGTLRSLNKYLFEQKLKSFLGCKEANKLYKLFDSATKKIRFQFLKFQMYDKNAEVEISWGLFHKVNKLFQVTGKPHNSRLKQDVRANRTFTWEQLKLEVLVFFSFLISFTNTFLKQRAKNYNCSHWYFRGLYPMKMNLYPCKLEQLKKSYRPLL